MSGKHWAKLVNDNIVFIVCIPLVVGIHWGWWKMQQNPALVDPPDRRDLPIYTVYQGLQGRFIEDNASKVSSDYEDKEILKD